MRRSRDSSTALLTAASVLFLLPLVSCANSADFGQCEPCFFVFEDDAMSGPAFCAIEITTRNPCDQIAQCLCRSWLPSATEAELEACIEDELDDDDEQARLSLLCNEETSLSVEDVITSFAAIREATLSIAGPCDAMPTHYSDVALVE